MLQQFLGGVRLMNWIPILAACVASAQTPDVKTIIEKSVQANQRDFQATPQYNNKEKDRTAQGTKTYQSTMIDGTPYQRLIAVNGKPLSSAEQASESNKEQQASRERQSQSEGQRRDRIAKYEKDRVRDQTMTEQLTKAFDFALEGKGSLRGFKVYILAATPKKGYQPPNLDCQVLPGMRGRLWIDQKTFQWVRVTAQVVRPVSIEGFLAKVEPGTRFELNKAPVGDGIWQPSHFLMQSHAKVLMMVNHSTSADETYFDYRKK